MATTPNVQSFIQPIAQSNTPFLANNGNPGTVYNMPNTGSYKPPMASAQNQWALNPNASMYANNQFWLNAEAGTPTAGGGGNPFFVNPGLTTIPGSVVQPPVVVPTGTVVPPVTTQPPVGNTTVNPNILYNPRNTGGVFNPGPLGTVVSNVGTSANNYTQGAGGNTGTGINWSGGVQGILGSLGQALGMNQGGGMDWQQALDLILPGDLYNNETGRWNAGNALVAGANAINPALGALVQLAVDNGWGPAALRQRIIDDGLAQANADLRGTVADLTAQTQAIMDNRTNQTLADRAANTGANAFNNAINIGGAALNTGWGAGQLSPITGMPLGTLGSSPFDTEGSTILDRMEGWGTGTAPTRDGRSGTSTGSGVVWSAENGGNFAGGNERAFWAELDALKNKKPGIGTRSEK